MLVLLLLQHQLVNQQWQLQLQQRLLLLLAGMYRSSNVAVTVAARGLQPHLNKTGGALVTTVLALMHVPSARTPLLHAKRHPLPAFLHDRRCPLPAFLYAKRLPLPASRMVLLLLLQLTAGVLVDLDPLQILHPLRRPPLGGGAETACTQNVLCQLVEIFVVFQAQELCTQYPPLIPGSMVT
jgi:hypothetical protein